MIGFAMIFTYLSDRLYIFALPADSAFIYYDDSSIGEKQRNAKATLA